MRGPVRSATVSDRRVAGRARLRWDVLSVIGLGGAVGSAARWAVGEALPAGSGDFPWGTLLVNMSGALLLGLLMVLVLELWPPTRYLRPFLATGALGGYTTFSAYVLEARDLMAGGHVGTAALYVLGTVALGLAATWAGIAGGRATVAAGRRRARHDGWRNT